MKENKNIKNSPISERKFDSRFRDKELLVTSEELDNIRRAFPKIHLYEGPLIGTEEIRQYMYCKRILFFRKVLNAPMKQTYKMEYGMKKHERLQKQANKAKKETQKYFNEYLTSAQLGLVGLIDYFEFDGTEAYPVEIKSGRKPPKGMNNPHKYQVTAQAMLIEENYDFLVKKVRVYYSEKDKAVDYPITIENRREVINIINEIVEMLENEQMPEPTKHKGKCVDCECRLYCLRG